MLRFCEKIKNLVPLVEEIQYTTSKHWISPFYSHTDENPDANNERVSLENHDPMVVDWNIDNYCNPSNGPSMEQFHMIVKQGCCFLQKFPFISFELLPIGILHKKLTLQDRKRRWNNGVRTLCWERSSTRLMMAPTKHVGTDPM